MMKKLHGWLNMIALLAFLLGVFATPRRAAAQAPIAEPVPNPAAEAYVREMLAGKNWANLLDAFPDPKDRVISGEFLVLLLGDKTYQNRPSIILKNMTVSGNVDLYNIQPPYDLFIYDVIFKNYVNLGSSHFQRLRIRNTVFEKFVYFDQSVIEKNLELSSDTFSQGVYFKGAQIGADLLIENCKILGTARVPEAIFATYPSEFWQMKVGRSAVFDGTVFEGETTFARSNFSSASFIKAQFGGKATFSRMHTDSDTSFSEAVFSGETAFDRAIFGDTSFKDAQFLGRLTSTK